MYSNLVPLTVTSNLVPTAGSECPLCVPFALWNSPCHTDELAPVNTVAVAGVVPVPGFEAST